MGIVEEIISVAEVLLDGILTGYSKLPYAYQIAKNNDKNNEKGYSFTSGAASFAEGRAMGFTTMDHTFDLNLVDCYVNNEGDEFMRVALNRQYELAQEVLKEMQKSKLSITTGQVLLISGLSMDEPELIDDNTSVVLKLSLNIQYRYRNN